MASSVPASAQRRDLEHGEKIRFSIGSGSVLHEAALDWATRDSLILQSCATCDRLRYGHDEVHYLQVWRRSSAGSRALRGFGIGGAIGFGIAGISAATCHGTADKCEGSFALLGILGFAAGLLGAAIGYLSAGSWQSVA
jgi:hypothetical protein